MQCRDFEEMSLHCGCNVTTLSVDAATLSADVATLSVDVATLIKFFK